MNTNKTENIPAKKVRRREREKKKKTIVAMRNFFLLFCSFFCFGTVQNDFTSHVCFTRWNRTGDVTDKNNNKASLSALQLRISLKVEMLKWHFSTNNIRNCRIKFVKFALFSEPMSALVYARCPCITLLMGGRMQFAYELLVCCSFLHSPKIGNEREASRQTLSMLWDLMWL